MCLHRLLLIFLHSGVALCAGAQERGPGGGPPGGPGGLHNPLGGIASPQPGGNRPAPNAASNPATRGQQLGPASRWWDDAGTARAVGLDAKQQRRMDAVFSASKPTLLKLYTNLKTEEARLASTTSSQGVSEAEVDQQIDRVSAARGELGKAYAHMQLQIRKEITPEQAARLDGRPGS